MQNLNAPVQPPQATVSRIVKPQIVKIQVSQGLGDFSSHIRQALTGPQLPPAPWSGNQSGAKDSPSHDNMKL
jgi:hypothetical protein